MTLAWNYLFGEEEDYDELPATHRYIKFSPQDIEEFKALEASSIIYVDFPLGYEVLQMGDFYPQRMEGKKFPDFYGVVEVDEAIPALTYQVLEDLVIPPYQTPLTARAFQQVGDSLAYFQALGPPGVSAIPDPCTEECPNYPNCFHFPQYFGCSGPPIFNGDCTPDSPDWPACMVIYDDDDDEELNNCGCPIPNDSRKPAGCIQVEDVERNGLFPARDIRVRWWDGWFTFKTVQTDAQGCWQIDGHREYGKAYMAVSFVNNRARLRGFTGNTVQIWRVLTTVTDYVGQLGGGTYNNIETEYNLWNNQGGRDHRNWSAATVMNALHHFHAEAQNDGITPPPMGLDIYLAANRTDGIALMTSQIPEQLADQLVNQGLFGAQLLPIVLNNFSILALVPDVVIGCNFQNSDRQWAITQHEIAHTSHFTNVGAVFWGQLGLATLNAEIATGDPWGDENVADAGRIAICESWAEHLEHVYTDRAYGGQVSNAFLGTFVDRLDAWRNHRLNHVPIGLHLDLLDNVEPMTSRDRFGGGTGAVIDNVTGLTNGQLFSVLDAATDDPQVYRQRVINDLLPGSGIAVGDVDALFNSY